MKELLLWHLKFGYGKYINEESGNYIIQFEKIGIKKISGNFLGKTLFFSKGEYIYEEIYKKSFIYELDEETKKRCISRFLNSIVKIQNKKIKLEDYYYDKLFNYLEKTFNFEGFHHYTDFTNFINILKERKIYSRIKILESEKLKCDAADKDVIEHTRNNVLKFVRFYFSSKTPTLYNIEGIKSENLEGRPHMPIPVLFVFDKKISKIGKKYFSNKNAGSKYSDFFSNFESIVQSDKWCWRFIFEREPIPDWENKRHILSCRNAEYLHWEEIDIAYANKIVFRTNADLKNAISLFGKNSKFVVDNSKFNCKILQNINFLEDYIIEQTEDEIKLNLFFARNVTYYTTNEINIEYENGHIEKITVRPMLIEQLEYEVIFKIEKSMKFNFIYSFDGFKIIYYKGMEDITF